MKICFFNLNAYSPFNLKSKAPIDGTEVQLFNIAKYLSDQGDIEVSFIIGDWGQKEIEKYFNITIYRSISLQKSFLNYLKAPFKIWNILGKIDADVYIASSAGAEIGLIALFCKIKNKKFIYRTAHDIDCNGEFVEKNGIIGKMFNYGMRHASKIIVQNIKNSEMIKKRYKIDSEIIFNAWHLENAEKNAKKNNFLWVGRCVDWKNPLLIIDIAQKFPKHTFTMISNKQAGNEELFKKVSKKVSFVKNIRFIERIPFEKIQDYYNSAELFIGTSEYEGFPNTYVQACLGKTPIISYKVNPDNFINVNNLGYCSEGNFDLMIDQIEKIFSDEEDWKIKSENAYNYVKKNHDINTIGKQWEKVIRVLLK